VRGLWLIVSRKRFADFFHHPFWNRRQRHDNRLFESSLYYCTLLLLFLFVGSDHSTFLRSNVLSSLSLSLYYLYQSSFTRALCFPLWHPTLCQKCCIVRVTHGKYNTPGTNDCRRCAGDLFSRWIILVTFDVQTGS
jgi:hypothetical protein